MIFHVWYTIISIQSNFQNPLKFTKTRITTERGRKIAVKRMDFKSAKSITDNMVEVTTNQRGKEQYPIHCGTAVLHFSKLILMKFVLFLNEFLKEKSFEIIYTGKIIHV